MNRIVEDSQDRIASIVGDAAEITRIARNQAQKVDRVFTDAVERMRSQVIRADHILTGALEVIEDTGSKFRKTLWAPVHQASAFLKGMKVGLDFIRGQKRPPESRPTTQDEELFI
jgi:5-hydroxyisourate hydrolase-like protein (transthyretin family)